MFSGHKEGYPAVRIFRTDHQEKPDTFVDRDGITRTVYHRLPPTIPARLSDLYTYPPFHLLLRETRFIQDRYGIKVKLGHRDAQDDQDIETEKANPVAAAECAILLREELAKYPHQYIKYCGVRRIRLVSSLKMPRGGDQMDACDGAVSPSGSIYVVHYPYNLPNVRGTIHHELSHFSGRLAQRHHFLLLAPIIRLLWNQNNPVKPYLGDSYGNLSPNEKVAMGTEGFATPYGRLNYGEDRATVAEALMSDTTFFYNRGKIDPALGQKIKLTMFDYWLKSGGLMNREYFNDLAKGAVDESYWDNKSALRTRTHKSFLSRSSVAVAAAILLGIALAFRKTQKDKNS